MELVTEEYLQQLHRLEAAPGCRPSIGMAGRLALAVCRLPLRLAEDCRRDWDADETV